MSDTPPPSSALDRLNAALAGRYCSERELGEGGMATVYLSRDLRHDREVAIKVLHPDLGAALGSERFLSEIKTTARLQHPHILPLLDSGDADGLLFYVMPLVTGETLRTRLDREKQLPLDDAVRIAREVASALDYAHRHGVIHRDIKPENILLHDGQALVADFGIALAVQSAGGARMTQTGLSLGTPQYMSPEQAMGERTIDARSDVYALGAVTYETLTGEPPFTGATVQAIVAKVLTERPMSPMSVRDTVPPHVAATVLKALAKLPADRFASAAQYAESLMHPEIMSATVQAQAAGATANVTAVPRAIGVRRWVTASPLVWLALVMTAAAGAYRWTRQREETTALPMTIPLAPPAGIVPNRNQSMSLSRDGSLLAFTGLDSTGQVRLVVRSLVTGSVSEGAATTATWPAISPDGKRVAYYNVVGQSLDVREISDEGVRKVTVFGASRGLTWLSDSVIVFSANGILRRVSARGGAATDVKLTAPAGTLLAAPNAISEDLVLTTVASAENELAAVSTRDGRVVRLGVRGTRPALIARGILAYLRDGRLFGVEFDPASLSVRSEERAIADENEDGPIIAFAAGGNSLIVHRGSQGSIDRELVLLDRAGKARSILAERHPYRWPRFSADAQHIVVAFSARNLYGDLWSVHVTTGALTRVNSDSSSGNPEWEPDGRHVRYTIVENDVRRLVRAPADGGGVISTVLTRPNPIYESALALDGRTVVWREDASGTSRDILSAPVDSPAVVRPVRNSTFDERGFAISPDGRWVAYTSNETAVPQVYLCRLEPNGPRWIVSRHGGAEPRWARTGELFFRQGDSVFVTRVEAGALSGASAPRVDEPTLMFTVSPRTIRGSFEPLWDVSPDGKQFVMVRAVSDAASTMAVMLNWVDTWRAAGRE